MREGAWLIHTFYKEFVQFCIKKQKANTLSGMSVREKLRPCSYKKLAFKSRMILDNAEYIKIFVLLTLTVRSSSLWSSPVDRFAGSWKELSRGRVKTPWFKHTITTRAVVRACRASGAKRPMVWACGHALSSDFPCTVLVTTQLYLTQLFVRHVSFMLWCVGIDLAGNDDG